MRHDQRMDPLAAVLADPQDGRALRPAQPLVAVARPVRGAQRVRHRPGTIPGACAASTSVSIPRRSSSATSSSTGKMSRGRARDMADQDQPGPRGHGGEDRVARRPSADAIGNGIFATTTSRPVARRHGPHRVDRRVVLVIVGQQLIAGLEPERLEHGVDPGRRVGDERESLGIRAEEPPDRAARVVEQPGQVVGQELDRLRLQPIAPGSLDLEDRCGARPVRAVVQERDRGIESPAEVALHSGMTGVSITSPDRATTVSPRSGSASQRASPGPTTRHDDRRAPGDERLLDRRRSARRGRGRRDPAAPTRRTARPSPPTWLPGRGARRRGHARP